MHKATLEAAIQEVLNTLGVANIAFVIERPGDMSHGDYASNVALVAARALKKNPRDVAADIVKRLSIPGIERTEVAGAGFINFFLSRDILRDVVVRASSDDSFSAHAIYAGKTFMVEYTDPNPFKEFHIGHLMSNTVGEAVARVLEHAGARVLRANYQGDVGPHVAKALFVLLERGVSEPTIADISSAYVEGARRFEENLDDKAAIEKLNRTIYDQSDAGVHDLYERGRALSLAHFEELYAMLGTSFDYYFFESISGPRGLALVRSRPDVFKESEGAVVYRGEKHGLHTRVFVNKLGLPTYEAKDLGLAELKKESALFDHSITITANEQDEYFKVVLAALAEVHPEWIGQFEHRSHGMMRFASGKMSSRLGNVITGESLLRDLAKEALEHMRGRTVTNPAIVAKQVAVGAVKYAVLKQGSGKDIVFDPEQSLSLEGDSGPYVQYAHTRALSLVRAAQKAGVSGGANDAPVHAHALERLLVHAPDVTERAAREQEPHHITTYLTELASTFNAWYAGERVLGGEHESYGVLLAQAVERVLARGLYVLGIPVPEEM